MANETYAIAAEIIRGYYNRIVVQQPDLETIIGWLESDLEFLNRESAVLEANNIIMNYDPHEVSTVKCLLCEHTWIAVRPKGVERLECPNCNKLSEFENQ